MKPRRSFEAGHQRKFLLIIDETPEVDIAVYFAASRASHSGGLLVLLYVIEPQDYQHWMGVRQIHVEEETNKAKALFRLHRRKLNQAGFENVVTEDVIKDGSKVDMIMESIDEDEDIGLLVLGASTDPKGPGPLVSTLVGSKAAGAFPVPITVVPGHLSLDYIKALA
jgi:nucleotide-binding universal stress UspA family protein